MANPQIKIIDLPTDTDISATVTTEYVPIESVAEGGRRITVQNFLTTGGAAIFVPRITSTDRAIATYNSTAGALRDNPNATIDASGIITAAGFASTSSRRYKENINSIYSGLSIINRLQGVRYHRKDNPNTHEYEIGLIAEDVYWVVPEVVKMDKDNQPEAVAYDRIVAVLINAVNELTARVALLENKQ